MARMTRAQIRKAAISAINKRGCLLVYPVNNKAEPRSIWSELWPRSRMRWEWDSGGDNRVAELWYLKEELSRSNQVVYAKWFQNRATLISREVFVWLLAYLRSHDLAAGLGGDSRNAVDLLMSDSPLSTKQLKAALELEGRLLESTYNRALKPLWQHLLIVGYGEFEDSSFPSLGIGASATLFEDLWTQSQNVTDAEKKLVGVLGEQNPFFKFAKKVKTAAPRDMLRQV